MSDGAFAGVLAAVRAVERRGPGEGQIVMLASARRGEGVSTVARDAAVEADAPVLLIDLDLKQSPQAAYYAREKGLGPARDGRINGASFVRLLDAQGARVESYALTLHRVSSTQIHVSRFDVGAIPHGARMQISGDAAYWQALRGSGALVIVDAPALERSDLALRLAPHMDAVVLVVAADAGAAPPAMAARLKFAAAGANVVGLVFARASAPQMALWARQAG